MNFESCKRGRTGYFHFLVSWLLNFLLFLRSSEDLSQILGQASKRAPGVAAGRPCKLLALPRSAAGAGLDGARKQASVTPYGTVTVTSFEQVPVSVSHT